jgi:hypothetical protein
MRGGIVEVVVALFHVFSVVTLRTSEAEESFFQDAVIAVPQREGKTQILITITNACDSIFIPAVGAGSRMFVRKVVPSVSVCAVVFADCSPRALAEIWAPVLPVDLVLVIFLKAQLFAIHCPGRL